MEPTLVKTFQKRGEDGRIIEVSEWETYRWIEPTMRSPGRHVPNGLHVFTTEAGIEVEGYRREGTLWIPSTGEILSDLD